MGLLESTVGAEQTNGLVQVYQYLLFIFDDWEKTFPDRFEPRIGTTIFEKDTSSFTWLEADKTELQLNHISGHVRT